MPSSETVLQIPKRTSESIKATALGGYIDIVKFTLFQIFLPIKTSSVFELGGFFLKLHSYCLNKKSYSVGEKMLLFVYLPPS